MYKAQLKIQIDPETKQRVEVAAAEKKISVDDYVLNAVQRQLAEESLQNEEPSLTKDESVQLAQEMISLREKILAERNNEYIDINAIIDLVRDERDAELFDLR